MAKKKRKINKMPYYIASATALFAAAAVCLAFYSATLKEVQPTTVSKESETVSAMSSDGAVNSRETVDSPVISTDIDGVFAGVNPNGVFTFYEYEGGKFVPCTDTKTTDIKVECSHQELPATLYYIERNGVLSGYGLFTTSISTEDIRLFDYAFFHAVNMPSGYGDDKHMLLVDYDGNDFAFSDKTYSEAFGFDIESGKTKKLTGDNGRTVDTYGRLRGDWAQLNDALISFANGKLYLSGRNYQLSSDKADLIFVEGNTKTKPTWKSEGLYDGYLNELDGKLYYVKESASGFEVFSMSADGTETKISAYAGKTEDYLFFEDYIFNKNNLVLKRISTDENKADISGNEAIAYPSFISVSPDGTKLVVLCNTSPQTAVLYDLVTKEQKVITDEKLFTTVCDQVLWLSADSFATICQNADNSYETLVWSF